MAYPFVMLAAAEAGPSSDSGLDLAESVSELFHEVGKDSRDSTISIDELRESMHRLSLPCSLELVRQVFREADVAGTGRLSHADLLRYVSRREGEILKAFNVVAGCRQRPSKVRVCV